MLSMPDRQPDEIFGYSGGLLLLGTQLLMSRAGRVDDQ